MRELLPYFSRPSHYLGSEWGAVRKDPDRVRVRVALAFPDLYDVGMAYVGQKILYSQINAREQFWAERVFAPSRDVAEVLEREGAPLSTLESDTPLAAMDAVAFSATHELCYTNVLWMLRLAGIPIHAEKRGNEHPLVVAGGGCAFNAEPLAPFMDAMALGDGEAVLPRIIETVWRGRDDGWERPRLLEELARVQGVYIPSFFEFQGRGQALHPLRAAHARVDKAVSPDLNEAPFPTDLVVPFGKPVHDRFAIEIARGCTRGCRFCHAGMVYRPVRERSLDTLGTLLEKGLEATGYEELSFLSLSTGDFSALDGLFERSFERCAAEQVSISLPSLRVGSVSGRLMDLIGSIRRTGATLAPEAGSQRLRDVINKGVTEEQLLEHVSRLFDRGWQSVKLYFMIGLPTETEDDLRAIFDLACKVEAAAGRGARRLQVTAAVSPFVPKPYTPFQWERQISLEETREKIGLLRSLFSTRKRLKLKWHEPEMSFLEGVFSRAGRELAPVVERALDKGALFTSWLEQMELGKWLEAMAEEGLEPGSFLAARDPQAPLPWDHLNPGVSRSFLLRERERAMRAGLTPDCRFGACVNCGVCAFEGRTSTLCGEDEELRPRLNLEQRDQECGSEPEAASIASAPRQEPADRTAAKPRPPRMAEQLTRKAGHYRVWYAKTGPAAYLSTLELQTVLERSLRRANIGVTFSRGFHPAPLISFGHALPVGVESLAEWFNLFTRDDHDPAELARRLDESLPAGFRVTACERLGMGRKQPQPDTEDFELVHTGPEEARQAFLRRWREFSGADIFPMLRTTKRGQRTDDVRPFVSRVEVEDEGAVRLTFDWRRGYMSPLAIVRAVSMPSGEDPASLRLRKMVQRFSGDPAPASSECG